MMRKDVKNILDAFQSSKGKLSLYCFNLDILKDSVYQIITGYIAKHNSKILIVVTNYDARLSIRNYLVSQDEFIMENVTILSASYINEHYKYPYKLIITIGVSNYNIISKLKEESSFLISYFTKHINDANSIINIRKILPDLGYVIGKINTSIHDPVEGILIGCDLIEADGNGEYDRYNNYIKDCISIFGDIPTINKCRIGDASTNTSSISMREQVARLNGWSPTLDMSSEFNREIDRIYNPIALGERCNIFFTATHRRRDILFANIGKYQPLLDIIEENKGSKIVVVSGNDNTAISVNNAINEKFGEICGCYCDNIPPEIAYDVDGITPIRYKSGAKKGEVKYIKSQAICSRNELRFNNDTINVLSIKSSSLNSLKIAIDLVIFTSTLCDNIIDFKKRYTEITFNKVPNIIYILYTRNTIEEKKIKDLSLLKELTLTRLENKNCIYDEKTNDIIL